jgi:hypothetical protein
MIFSQNRFTLFGIMLQKNIAQPEPGWAKLFPGFVGAKN